MEPSLLISIAFALGKYLLDLIFCASYSSSSTSALCDELNCFHSKLLVNLRYWEDRCADIAAAGFTPKALENLIDEMQEFVSIAEDLFKKPRLKKEDIRKFREDVMTAFQWGMTSAVFEVLGEIFMELKAERMVVKPAVQIIIIQQQDLDNPKLEELLSFVLNTPHATKTFQEYLKDVLPSGVGHASPAVSTSKAHSICKSEEEQNIAEIVEQSKKEKLEMTKAAVMKENQEKEENRKNNPNLSMSFSSDHVPGRGVQLGLSRRDDDGKIEVTLKGPPEVVSAMIGVRPMKVSGKLGYFYFEVEVVEMVELSGTSKTSGYAGVGVGLATRKKFRNDKMVGWYPESFGYDGRVDVVYCEKRPLEPFRIGILAKGDTLGIGLLQLPSVRRPAIFFVKNGVLQGCTQKHRLERSSICHLHPVITLASRCAKLCVNFHGPFHLPSGLDLAAALGITQ